MSMVKHRLFWTGMGGGLVVGALLLQLMNASAQISQSSEPQLPRDTWDEQTWRLNAEEAGFALYPLETRLYTEEQIQQQVAEALAGVHEQSADAQPDGGVLPEETEANSEEVTVDIASGMLASEVADYLQAQGVISDRDQFEQRMKDRKLTPNIRRGTYTFAKDEDIDIIIDYITFP